MFCFIVLNIRITTTITGRNFLTFITGEMLALNSFSRKFHVSLHQKWLQLTSFGVNLHLFSTVYLLIAKTDLTG